MCKIKRDELDGGSKRGVIIFEKKNIGAEKRMEGVDNTSRYLHNLSN